MMGSEITSKHFLVGGDPYGLSVRTIGPATPNLVEKSEGLVWGRGRVTEGHRRRE